MANMNTSSGVFQLPITISSNGLVTKTLSTQDTYIDKNIKVVVTTPDASFEQKDKGNGSNGEITAEVNTTDTTYTSDSITDYPITITADAHVNSITVGTKTAGFTAATDEITVAASDATQASKTIYVKAGTLSGSGAAGAESANVSLTKVNAAPTDGSFYIKASGTGNVGIATAGWVDPEKTTSISTDSNTYYTVPAATLANTGSSSSTEVTTPVLTEDGYLFITEGYIKNTKISLATLVPNDSTLGTVTNASSYMYNTIQAYDNDGKLVTGTMGDASLGSITASDASAEIASLTIAANSDKTSFSVTGSKAITGTTSVSIASRGLAETSLSKSGTISGTATVAASINKIGLGVGSTGTGTVTPVIAKESTSTAKSGTATTTVPTGQYYVAVGTAELKNDVTISAKVISDGYGTSSVFSQTDGTVTAGANPSGTYYIPITSATHTVTKSASEITAPVTTVTTSVSGGDVTPVTYAAAAKVAGTSYVAIDSSSSTADGSVKTTAKCASTEGYIEAFTNDVVTTESVSVAAASATTKYIKVYGGEILDA